MYRGEPFALSYEGFEDLVSWSGAPRLSVGFG